jgi:UDP-N-acetylglucosamine 2-epimerase (non-hydrolysing)
MAELLERSAGKIESSDILTTLKIEKDGYFLVSAHREENIDNEENFTALMTALNNIAEQYQKPIIYSMHPRTLDRITKRGFKLHELIQSHKPFGFFDYNRLQKDALCVLSDSGTLAEESAILGFSGVSLRTSTERPEVLDKGSFVVGGITTSDIIQAINLSRLMKENSEPTLVAPDYQDTNVSIKVVKIIQSFTKIVDKVIWDK